MRVRNAFGFFALTLILGCASAPVMPQAPVANEQLYRVDKPGDILKAARSLMESDENMALVTVDGQGQPRARSVRAFLSDIDETDPRAGMTVWVMTRDSTRKIGQIMRNPKVTLYFNDDAKFSYLSLMGTATVHTDPEHRTIKAILAREALEGYAEYFWPNFPEGFVMIEVQPRWIEFMGPGVKNHPEHWRPQAVEFSQD